MNLRFYLVMSLLLFSCKPSTERLPILSYTIDNKGSKDYYTITYSNFTNQLGQDFNTAQLEGNICIANFFFTRCPSICPPMRQALMTLAEEFKHHDNVLFISHTIDPKHDTVAVLKSYSEGTNVIADKWQFIRSTESNTKAQAEQYMTSFHPFEDGTDFYHSSYVVLLDSKQNIRGFYNSLVEAEMKRLSKDVRYLLK